MELESRPGFFKVLVRDFSQQLDSVFYNFVSFSRGESNSKNFPSQSATSQQANFPAKRIPRAFVNNFNGRVPRFCGLRGPSGNLWAVRLKEIEDRLVFHDGWQSFAKHHNLQIGDCLTFTLDGVSSFDVTIYCKSYCEKNVEAAENRTGNVVDRTTKKRLAAALVEETFVEPISLNLANPYFSTTYKNSKSMLYDLKIPTRVVRAAGLMSNETTMLQDPAGRQWPVKLQNATRGRLRMGNWYKCVKGNQISVGDTLIIEVVNHSVLQLHVSKVGEPLDVDAQG